MSKVYVVQENPRLDYSDAEKYGEVIFLTNHDYRPSSNSLMNERMYTVIREKLAGFNVNHDALLLSGDPINICLCFYTIASKIGYPGFIYVLKWDNYNKQYCKIQVNL